MNLRTGGVKQSKNFADVIYGSPLSYVALASSSYHPHHIHMRLIRCNNQRRSGSTTGNVDGKRRRVVDPVNVGILQTKKLPADGRPFATCNVAQVRTNRGATRVVVMCQRRCAARGGGDGPLARRRCRAAKLTQ